MLPSDSRLRAAVSTAVAAIGQRVLLTGATRETALGTAAPALRLDPHIEFGIGRAAAAGLALDAYDPVRLDEYTCLLLRLSPHGIDMWHLPPPAPGVDPRCTGYAAAGLGFGPPAAL